MHISFANQSQLLNLSPRCALLDDLRSNYSQMFICQRTSKRNINLFWKDKRKEIRNSIFIINLPHVIIFNNIQLSLLITLFSWHQGCFIKHILSMALLAIIHSPFHTHLRYRLHVSCLFCIRKWKWKCKWKFYIECRRMYTHMGCVGVLLCLWWDRGWQSNWYCLCLPESNRNYFALQPFTFSCDVYLRNLLKMHVNIEIRK